MLSISRNTVADALLSVVVFATMAHAGICGKEVYSPSGVDADIDTEFLDTYYINSQEDADQLMLNCSGYSGRLVISTNSTTNITLDSLLYVYGPLDIIDSTSLSSISALSLLEVGGNLTFSNLQNFSTINFPNLWSLPGFVLSDLPKVDAVNLPALQGDSSSRMLHLHISNSSLSAFNSSQIKTLKDVRIVDNPNFNDINLNTITFISDTLQIASNGPTSFIDLSSIVLGPSMTIKEAAGMDISKLSTATDFVLWNNSFSSFEGPNFGEIYGSLNISSNKVLSSIDLPSLGIVKGDFSIQDNPSLQVVDNLTHFRGPSKGNLIMTGDFSSINLPTLSRKDIEGSFLINTTSAGFDCTTFDRMFETGKYYNSSQPYTCFASSPNSTEDSAIHYKKPSRLSGGAKAGIAVGVIVGVALIAGALWFGISRKQKRQKSELETRTQKTASETDVTL